MTEICIPYAPRPLQKVIHHGMNTHRFGAVVCHRRFGKTVCAVNHLQRAAMECGKLRPRFAYIGPTYTQAKAGVWDYAKHFAGPVLDHTVNESELRIDFHSNGSQVRLFGSDNPDSLRGLYFDGVVLDENGLMPPKIFTEVVRPALSDRKGWALFMGTPNGKNEFYKTVQKARSDHEWFFAEYKASETGLLDPEELRSARQSMTSDEYAQEFECSFEASVKGAIYAREIIAAREDGRITRVPYDPALPVDTDWDLGVGDATAIWFSQSLSSREVRLIDYYEANGHGLGHFKQVLNDKGYTYGTHWAPHDIQVRELSSGHSRLDAARSLGLYFQISPKVNTLEDGIHAARMLLPRCWFDNEKCATGIEALQQYRWKPSDLVKNPTGKPLPVHDWSSHGADAFRGLAYRHHAPAKTSANQTLRQLQHDPEVDERSYRSVRRMGRRGGY